MTACFNKMTAMSLTCSSTPLVPTRRSRPQIEIPKRLRICSIQNPVFIIINNNKRAVRVEASNSEEAPSPGLYSARKYELNAKNVDMVLEDVRPYLIADGGNVDVVSVDDDGVISLKLQGACESCPSSTTTMTMGIEKVLKEKFGDAVKEIRQVNDVEVKETTVETVNNHLDILRPAIKNYGGSVEVVSVEGADCLVEYVGPESIGSGIKAAIKERFPDISNVVFTSS